MKKHVFGKKLKRDTNERKALFKNLLTSLVLNEKVKTTEAKAKAIRSAADKLITKAKKALPNGQAGLPAGRQGERDAYRALEAEVHHEAVVKLIEDLASRFKSRNGGYTRIIKSGRRVADNAPMVMMEWTESANIKIENEKSRSKIKKEEKKKVVKTKKEVKPVKKIEKKPEKKETRKKK